jgi:hypothetical protein
MYGTLSPEGNDGDNNERREVAPIESSGTRVKSAATRKASALYQIAALASQIASTAADNVTQAIFIRNERGSSHLGIIWPCMRAETSAGLAIWHHLAMHVGRISTYRHTHPCMHTAHTCIMHVFTRESFSLLARALCILHMASTRPHLPA